MKVKNATPFPFGAKLTARTPPAAEMTLVVKASLALRAGETAAVLEEQPALTGDVFADGDDERRGELLYASDFADFKLNAELVVRATAHAPAQEPVSDFRVRVAVGAWSKSLRVLGPRKWSDSGPSAVPLGAAPFTRLKLDYAEAFGGPGFAKNPIGKGLASDALPRIEDVRFPLVSRADRLDPAGFGPLNPTWALRAGKLGRAYGPAYRKTRAPFYAEDFDWTHFHAAPPDQQWPGYLRGDEELRFVNLHPEHAELRTRLPALRLRAFARHDDGRLSELAMNLDTLCADVDAATVTIVWRGLEAVRERDLSDVATLLLASEPLASEPLPVAHYAQEMTAFEADPYGLKSAFPPELGAMLGTEPAPPAPPGITNPVAQAMTQRFGALAHGAAASVQAALASAASAGPQAKAALSAVSIPREPAPLLMPLKPGSMPPVRLGPAMGRMLGAVERAKNTAAAHGRDAPGLGAASAAANDPRLQALDPSYVPPKPGAPARGAPGPRQNLAGCDFSDKDLAGADFSRCNLEDAIFTRANLKGASFAGANLKYAVFFEAEIGEADFTEADLTQAQLARVAGAGAVWRRAIVEQASFEEADLSRAVFEDASGEYVQFSRARLAGVKGARARLDCSWFDEAMLEGADFTQAKLARTRFGGAGANGMVLEQATLTHASFEGAAFARVRAARCDAAGTVWLSAKLDETDLRRANLAGAFFIGASACGASFVEARLRGASFQRAALDRTSFDRADLFGADFQRASLEQARFGGANLYDAKFVEARLRGCDFAGANLTRALRETRE